MSFEDILNKHNNHEVVIIDRYFKNRFVATPGLYCSDCGKLIKWLSDEVAEDLIYSGVKHLGMTKMDKLKLNLKQVQYGKVKNVKAGDIL